VAAVGADRAKSVRTGEPQARRIVGEDHADQLPVAVGRRGPQQVFQQAAADPEPAGVLATYTVYSATPAYHGRCENGASADQPSRRSSRPAQNTGAFAGRAASQAWRSVAVCGPVAKVALPSAMPSS